MTIQHVRSEGEPEFHSAQVSFEELGGSRALFLRLRLSGISTNLVFISLASLSVYYLSQSKSFIALAIPICAVLIFVPLINIFMSGNMRKSNQKLLELFDRKGSFHLSEQEFSEAANALLRAPWMAILRVTPIWIIFGLPLFALTYTVWTQSTATFLQYTVPVLLWMPFLVVVLLLRIENILSPYVRTLFSSRGVTSIDSPWAITTGQRLLFLQVLTGPYLFLMYSAFVAIRLHSDAGQITLTDLLPIHVSFALLYVVMCFLANAYSSRTFDRPFAQLISALKGPTAQPEQAERVDEWLVAAELLRQKTEAERKLRMSEAKFRTILEIMPVGALVLKENHVDLTNRTMCHLLQAELTDLIGRPVWDVLQMSQTQWRVLESTHEHDRVPLELTSGAEIKYVELAARTFETEWGERFLLLVQDVSERKKLERLKQEFFAMISHELRTPLTAVGSFLTLLQRGIYGEINDVAQARCKGAANNVDRLIKLISDLLDAEKLEAGEFDCTPVATTSKQVVDRALDAVGAIAAEQDIELQIEVADVPISVDEDRITQVLVNLLGNALRFSEGKPVKVAAGVVDSSVEFLIEDHGKGIPDEAKEDVFEKFRQVKGQTKGQGTGLGLAIARALIHQHGGTIGVRDTEGGGATFWFRIPL